MIFNNFKIRATPHIYEAHCKCGEELIEVDNGWVSTAYWCPKCNSVYVPKLIKLPKNKVTKEFLKQCRQDTELRKAKMDTVRKKHKEEDEILI